VEKACGAGVLADLGVSRAVRRRADRRLMAVWYLCSWEVRLDAVEGRWRRVDRDSERRAWVSIW
jgi:hypothetical protein